jgi:hypothetical protein
VIPKRFQTTCLCINTIVIVPFAGGASYVNTAVNSTGFSVLNNATLAMNSEMDVGQYYEEEKFCK